MHGSITQTITRLGRRTFVACALACLVLTSACSRSDRAVMDQSESLINQRRYQDAVNLLEKEMPNHGSAELKTQLGYAYLGLSGIEMISLAQHVSFLKSFQNVSIDSKSFDQKCPELPFEFAQTVYATCLPLVKIEGFPSPDNPSLIKALAIFDEVYPDAATTDQNINLLLAVVQIGVATANYDLLLTQQLNMANPADLKDNRELQIQFSTQTLKYFKHSLSSLFAGLHHLFYSYGKIKRFLDKYNGKPILKIGGYTYYGSQNISADDFFQFLIASGRGEIQDVVSKESKKQSTVEDFSRALSRSMSFLNLQIADGREDFLGNYYMRFLGLGASIVPQRFNYDQTPNTNFTLDPKDVHLPKMMLRMIQSVSNAWIHEDTGFIFNVMDETKKQYDIMSSLSFSWKTFWDTLDATTQEKLKQDLNGRMSQIPTVSIDPDHLPDTRALHDWYTAAFEQMQNVSTDLLRDSAPYNPYYEATPELIKQTQSWVDDNLW